jgi:hypothetical protein
MRHTAPVIRTRFRLGLALGVLSGLAALGLGGPAAWADTCTAPAGGPSGPDAPAFTYQCDGTYAGDWTSAYYVYDPATATETPLYTETYKYDCANQGWLQTEWDYDPTGSAYVENWVPATITPTQTTDCTTSDPGTPATTGTSGDNTGATGTDTSTSSVTGANTQTSNAQSGNAVVAGNGQAGDATSGNSSVEVTQANLVDTNGNPVGSATVFTASIGDMNGNLLLDPGTLPTGAGAQSPASSSATTTDDSLTNTITATAASGNAVVAGNGDAGDATSGNAQAIINLINIINSSVSAGQSFIGTINIYGDFNGNILVPQSLIDELLAMGAGSGDDPSSLSTNTNESITNNVAASATSGDAKVVDNSGAYGSATTGTANTNVTILNLTGSSVVGKNVLLVFVNVLGTWIGVLMNAPAGTTSGEYAGGVSSSAPGNNAPAVANDATMDITNNVDASAVTGNAIVAHNQNAGNATSGNADVAVNILNIADSELSLANWFGILFINVFGTWNGSFGVYQTPAPTPVTPSGSGPADGIAPAAFAAVHGGTNHNFAAFVPAGSTTAGEPATAVLGATTSAPVAHYTKALSAPDSDPHASYVLPALGFCLAALILAFSERKRIFGRGKEQ